MSPIEQLNQIIEQAVFATSAEIKSAAIKAGRMEFEAIEYMQTQGEKKLREIINYLIKEY